MHLLTRTLHVHGKVGFIETIRLQTQSALHFLSKFEKGAQKGQRGPSIFHTALFASSANMITAVRLRENQQSKRAYLYTLLLKMKT